MGADDRTAAQRSKTMRAVKSKNTEPEKMLRSLIHRMGYRYRLHVSDMPGTPDLVFPGRKKIIFLHGCFWHGHDCKRGNRLPQVNKSYWFNKIEKNRTRDKRVLSELKSRGWSVLVVWECELKNHSLLIEKLRKFLN